MSFQEFKQTVLDLCEAVKENRPVHFTGYRDGYSARITDDNGDRWYLVYNTDTGKWDFRFVKKSEFE